MSTAPARVRKGAVRRSTSTTGVRWSGEPDQYRYEARGDRVGEGRNVGGMKGTLRTAGEPTAYEGDGAADTSHEGVRAPDDAASEPSTRPPRTHVEPGAPADASTNTAAPTADFMRAPTLKLIHGGATTPTPTPTPAPAGSDDGVLVKLGFALALAWVLD